MGRSLRSLTAVGGQPPARLYNASSTLAACKKPNLVNFGERLCENDHTVAFLGQSIGDSRYVFVAVAVVVMVGLVTVIATTVSPNLPQPWWRLCKAGLRHLLPLLDFSSCFQHCALYTDTEVSS